MEQPHPDPHSASAGKWPHYAFARVAHPDPGSMSRAAIQPSSSGHSRRLDIPAGIRRIMSCSAVIRPCKASRSTRRKGRLHGYRSGPSRRYETGILTCTTSRRTSEGHPGGVRHVFKRLVDIRSQPVARGRRRR